MNKDMFGIILLKESSRSRMKRDLCMSNLESIDGKLT